MSESWTPCAPAPSDPLNLGKTLPAAIKPFFESLNHSEFLTPELLALFDEWLAPVRDKIPQDITPAESAALADAILQEALARFDALLKGIRAYQDSPAQRPVPQDVAVLWQEGTTRLLDYAPDSQDAQGTQRAIIFVIPSLVNRFDILDIAPDHSFLRFLKAQGLRPLVVDWGEPGEAEQNFTFSDYMEQRLEPLLKYAKDSGAKPCHVLGYCMGGVLAMVLALRCPDFVRSLVLMATPWDFAVKGVASVPPYETWVGQSFFQQATLWEPCLEEAGVLPASFLQNIFVAYQPLQILKKYMQFANQSATGGVPSRFVLTEDWLNNGVPLAWPVARACLYDWYKDNKTGKLQWDVSGTRADPRKIACPVYMLVPTRDRIVPPESALPLLKLIPDATLHQPEMGHIGVMSGDAAPQQAWAPMVAWLKKQR